MAIDPETVILVLVSGSVGAVLGALVGALVGGHYAVEAVRKQSLRLIKQEAYRSLLSVLDDLVDLCRMMDEAMQLDVADPNLYAEPQAGYVALATTMSPILYFGGREQLERSLREVAVGLGDLSKDPQARAKFLDALKQSALGFLVLRVIPEARRLSQESTAFLLAEPGAEVEKATRKVMGDLSKVTTSMGAELMRSQLEPGVRISGAISEKEMNKLARELEKLKGQMLDDLIETL